MYRNAYYSPYQLQIKHNIKGSSGSKDGILLKFEFEDTSIGYSLYQSWEHLQEPSIQQVLKTIQQKVFLHEPCYSILQIAKTDAEARKTQINLSNTKLKINNYQSIGNIENLSKMDIKCHDIKWKWSNHKKLLQDLYPILKDYCSRIDFNLQKTNVDINALIEGLDIAYIEDPPINLTTRLPIAEDQYKSLPQKNIFIIKPVKELLFLQDFSPKNKVAFTSNLDHPLGQIIAQVYAANFYSKHPHCQIACGLMTHDIYGTTPYSEILNCKENVLPSIEGFGFGFDKLLEKENWIRI